jgi:4,5-DOPA dioxygenase extradiol
MTRQPVVFVSHGAPDALLYAHDAVECWREIGRSIPTPSAILAVSAHWEADLATVSRADQPATIHDFSGFPAPRYRLRYPAPGAPALAERVVALLTDAGVAVATHPTRGLDHGAWVPLSAMFPGAEIPVAQLSLTHQNPTAHLRLGQALAALRDEGVLILASGAITHNFTWLDFNAAQPHSRAVAFADWMGERLAAGETETLLDYRAAPHGAESHPSEEHLLPLFVALGAGAGERPRRLRPNYTYGGLAMDAYVWGDTEPD